MRAQFEREADMESPWTSYNASLGRPLLNSAKFLATKPGPPEDAAAVAEPEPEPEPASASREAAPTLPGFEG
jgi:hypothetical protein